MSENYDNETGEIIDVDFDDYLGFANTPLKDDKSYIKAKLTKIEKKLTINSKNRTSRDLADDITQKCFKFVFDVIGNKENITMSILTGTNIRPDKVHVKAKGRGKTKEQPEYNKLTELLLRLNVFTIEELNKRDEIVLNKTSNLIKNIGEKPIYIKAKLEIQNNDTTFETINIKSIEIIPNF
jgi:hypothetical protein